MYCNTKLATYSSRGADNGVLGCCKCQVGVLTVYKERREEMSWKVYTESCPLCYYGKVIHS